MRRIQNLNELYRCVRCHHVAAYCEYTGIPSGDICTESMSGFDVNLLRGEARGGISLSAVSGQKSVRPTSK